MSYLIADSGSTKTHWCLLKKNKKPQHFYTPGINPFLQSKGSIAAALATDLPLSNFKNMPEAIFYFGAGAASRDKKLLLEGILKSHFETGNVSVEGDMMGAALGLCGNEKGIVCILGTGSSTCYFDGKKIKERQPSLGYIAGDEGSGNHMGKRVLQYYTYGTFDDQLKMDFEMRFGKDLASIIHKLYHEPYPNRYLASFVTLLQENRGHYMVENIIEDCVNDFFQRSILKYRQTWKKKLYFSGSVAFGFQDVIIDLCGQYELEPGKIVQSPMDGLIKYYHDTLFKE
jgi:N-acetylglucosamine kinase-like BadF-type ATPase